jgi:hypothetical protein
MYADFIQLLCASLQQVQMTNPSLQLKCLN